MWTIDENVGKNWLSVIVQKRLFDFCSCSLAKLRYTSIYFSFQLIFFIFCGFRAPVFGICTHCLRDINSVRRIVTHLIFIQLCVAYLPTTKKRNFYPQLCVR